MVVIVAVVLTAVWWYTLTRDGWFFWDEWLLAGRGRSAGDLLRPYNGHLSITYLAVYRLHMALFGLDHHWVLQVIGVTALASVPLLFHLTTRRRLGPFLAGVAAVLLLWQVSPGLEAGAMNHSGAMAMAVLTAWALERRSAASDVVVAVTLVLGLATSGGTVAVALGALVHCLLSRARWWRWAAVAGPLVVWFGWYRWLGSAPQVPDDVRPGIADTVELLLRAQIETVRGLGLGTTVGGVLVAAALVAGAVRQVKVHRVRGAATLLTWLVADAVWWCALAQSRGPLADPEAFRYRWATSVFLLLAIVPPVRRAAETTAEPVASGARRPPWASSVVQAGALALFVALLAVVNADDTRSSVTAMTSAARRTRVAQVTSMAVPPLYPADYHLGYAMGDLTPEQVAALSRTYGPGPIPRSELDAALVDVGAVRVVETAPAGSGPCQPLGQQTFPGLARLRTDEATTLWVRRFGDEPTPALDLPADSEVLLGLGPTDLDPQLPAWRLVADGACVVPVG